MQTIECFFINTFRDLKVFEIFFNNNVRALSQSIQNINEHLFVVITKHYCHCVHVELFQIS